LHPSGPVLSPRSPVQGATWAAPRMGLAGLGDSGDAGESAFEFVLAVSGDEKLLRRLNEVENAETCTTGSAGSEARWRLEPGAAAGALLQFAGAS
jgi:hypothetical protein